MSLEEYDSGLSKLALLAIGGMFAWAIHKGNKSREEAERKETQERQRKKSKCKFEDGITESEFAELALKVTRRIKRVKKVYVSGAVINGVVESQSGISTWEFSVDFNDYGHITGKYWIDSENEDSNIPNQIGKTVSEQLFYVLDSRSSHDLDDVSHDETDSVSVDKSKKFGKTHVALISFAILSVIGLYAYCVRQESKLIPVGIDSISLYNLEYSDVYDRLTEYGFVDISINEVSDLSYVNHEKVGQIISVTIDGVDSFVSGDVFPYDAEITITYHGLTPVYPPISDKEAKGKIYTDIQASFADAGFVNIKYERIPDVIIGILTKDGEVDSVIIDGASQYSESEPYKPDVEVIIKYHTLRKSK